MNTIRANAGHVAANIAIILVAVVILNIALHVSGAVLAQLLPQDAEFIHGFVPYLCIVFGSIFVAKCLTKKAH